MDFCSGTKKIREKLLGKRRSGFPGKNKKNKRIHFSNDVLAVEKDYESPQVDSIKSRCSMPCNTSTVNDITDKDRPIADLMDIMSKQI